jgi:predicted ATP-dependent endonuclease of OLD family
MKAKNKKYNLNILNIGLIKKANLNLSSLTVIAGENDSGKSTVGKVLMALIKSDNTARHKFYSKQSNSFAKNRMKNFDKQIELLFDNNITDNGEINFLVDDTLVYDLKIVNNRCNKFDGIGHKDTRDFLDCTLIQTPLVWDLYEFFVSIATQRTENDIYGYENNIQYPYILWDLYAKLAKKRIDCEPNEKLIDEISQIIKGNRRITADTALRLSSYFGNSAKFWLGLQDDYDIEVEKINSPVFERISHRKNTQVV